MDGNRFDDLARVFGVAASRSAFLRSAVAALLAGTFRFGCRSGAAAQEVFVPVGFFGRWAGGGTQMQPSAEWPVDFTLWSGNVGSVVGSVVYPSYDCRGELILVDAAPDGTTIEVVEHITQGAGFCIDGGTFTLNVTESDALSFTWNAPSGSTIARGTVLSIGGREAEPDALGQMRVMIMACEGTSEARWSVSTMFGAVDPGQGCSGVDEPRRLAITGSETETQFSVETSGGGITLPLGDYMVTDEATGASTAFAMTRSDRRQMCDGLPACGLAVLVVPVHPEPTSEGTGPERQDDARLGDPAPMPGVATVVVFAPGIDPYLKPDRHDPYERARETFAPIIDRLGCVVSPVGPPRCDQGVVWLPFSYGGVDPMTGPRPYTGEDTGQPLLLSRNAMQGTIAYARSLAPAARIVVVGHSLGGAVAAFYGADDPAVQVITLDSPVNGIWTDDQAILGRYCSDSAGLLGLRSGVACPHAIALPGLGSDAAGDLRRPDVQERMGYANVVNFANAVDLAVPSWTASHPASLRGTVVISATCLGALDPSGMREDPSIEAAEGAFVVWAEPAHHGCVIGEAADAVVEIVRANRWPRPDPRAAMIPLTVRLVATGGQVRPPARAEARVLWPGQPEAPAAEFETPLGSGQAVFEVPWRDVLVELTLFGELGEPLGTYCRGALPGQNRPLDVTFLFPEATPGACPPIEQAASPEPPAATGQYTVIDLGTLPGTTFSVPEDINASGEVVGIAMGITPMTSWAFLWADGTMTDLGQLPGARATDATAITNAGQVAGSSGESGGAKRAFLWDRGRMTELTGIPNSTWILPADVNTSAQVVGRGGIPPVEQARLREYAFLYSDGIMLELGSFGGRHSAAWGMNAAGQVVGGADTVDGIQHAFLYSDGQMTDIGALPGHEMSVAAAINDLGIVVGTSHEQAEVYGVHHAFSWRDGVVTDLGVLPGFTSSYANDINGLGHVVGGAGNLESGRAVLWRDGEMRDLNDLIPGDSGWTLIEAKAINEFGQIVGRGHIDGQPGAFLLTPVDLVSTPPPTNERDEGVSSGLIAFTRDRNLHLMSGDGTDAIVAYAGDPPGPSVTEDSDPWYVWAPDGGHLAILPVLADAQQSWPRPLLLYNVDSGVLSELTGAADIPTWSSGGRYLVYREPLLPAEPWGAQRTILLDVASGARQTLVAETSPNGFDVWALDGPELIYSDFVGLPADRRPRAFRTNFAGSLDAVPTFDLPEGCVNDASFEDYEYLQDPAAHLLMHEAVNWPQTAQWSVDQNIVIYNVSCRVAALVDLTTGETETRRFTQLALGPSGRMVVMEFGLTTTSSTALDLTAAPSNMGLAAARLGAVTEPLGPGHLPVWSADGSVVYFARRTVLSEYPPLSSTEFQGLRLRIRVCRSSLWRVNADGSGLVQLVELDAFGFGPVSPTPDGEALVFSSVDNSLALWEHRLPGDLFDETLVAQYAPEVRVLRLNLATGNIVTVAEPGRRPTAQPRLADLATMADPDIEVTAATAAST